MSDHDSCPFCRYSAMTDWVRGPVWVGDRFIFRDRSRPVIYFEPLNPVTPGHLLFVPADHSEHRDLDAATLALKSAYDYGTDGGPPEDFNVILSSGAAATQTIDHLHVHYIPRRAGDSVTLPWTGQHDAAEVGGRVDRIIETGERDDEQAHEDEDRLLYDIANTYAPPAVNDHLARLAAAPFCRWRA